jgi:predicted DNA-binding protein (MmcQ/YjbR family)
MNYTYLLSQGDIDYSLLLKQGFIFLNNEYFKRIDMNNNFYIEINIFKDIRVKVFDNKTKEEYFPIYVMNNNGEFTKKLKCEIDQIINGIINNCLIKNNVKDQVLKYVQIKYHTILKRPWEKYPDYITLNTNNTCKWYGLIMKIPMTSLNINGDNQLDVINIKLPSEEIAKLIDNINYFPAYHMNKKYWITIILNNKINLNELYKLIDESYKLVN